MAGDWCDWSSQYHQHDYITSDSRATWSEEMYGSMAQRVKIYSKGNELQHDYNECIYLMINRIMEIDALVQIIQYWNYAPWTIKEA